MAILRCLFPVALGCTGCATLLSGTSQKIPVSSTPIGAEVTVNDKLVGQTPLVLDLRRKDPTIITLKAEGHRPHTTILNRKRSAWFWLIPTIYGIPLLLLDVATGAAYKLEPEGINQSLVPDGPAAGTYESAPLERATSMAVAPQPSPARVYAPAAEDKETDASSGMPNEVARPGKPPGIGVSRHEIQSTFERLGWTFEFSRLHDGRPRVTSLFEGRAATIELIGPPEDLESAYMKSGTPRRR